MKEFIIVFLAALAISSFFNGWNPFASTATVPAPGQHQAADSAYGGASPQAAGQASPQSGNSTAPSGNPI